MDKCEIECPVCRYRESYGPDDKKTDGDEGKFYELLSSNPGILGMVQKRGFAPQIERRLKGCPSCNVIFIGEEFE